jgi:hypothetical protein
MSSVGRHIEKQALADTLTKVEDIVGSTRFRSSVTLSSVLGRSARPSLAGIVIMKQGLAIYLQVFWKEFWETLSAANPLCLVGQNAIPR